MGNKIYKIGMAVMGALLDLFSVFYPNFLVFKTKLGLAILAISGTRIGRRRNKELQI